MGAEVVRGDVGDKQSFVAAAAGCDAVMHTAARVGSWGSYKEFFRTNVTGTENAIASCHEHGIDRLVFTSTPSVVHRGGDVEGADESLPYASHFDAHYPKTKAIAERAVLRANDASLATLALRPHLIWGPGDTQLLPRFAEKWRAGRLRLCSGPPKLVDTVYIDNAVDAHLRALDSLSPGSPCAGKAYFISNGEPLPIDEVINSVLAVAGLGPVEKTISPQAAWTAGVVFEALYAAFRIRGEPPITRFVAQQLSTAHWFDIGAARRDLGYEPRVTFKEGLGRLRASLGES
jgi:nucleoside-diphosphate-sugar epimerase